MPSQSQLNRGCEQWSSDDGNTTSTDGSIRIKAKDLRDILEGSRDMLETGSGHSELVIYRPRTIAILGKVNSLAECPEGFVRYAIENNLPIILIGT